MKRALITGIGGQDGSYLAELLLERGYAVAGMVRPGSFAETLGFLGKNYDPAYETGAKALGCEGFRWR